MCGIAGIRKFGNTPIRPWQITFMACQLEYRGNDATGIALMNAKGDRWWIKDHDPAWRFTSSPQYKKFLKDRLTPEITTVLIHTRRWTVGTCYENMNNHPIVMEKDPQGIIVHNGSVTNADDIFFKNKEFGFERSCKTDSDAIRAILDYHGGIDKDTGLIKDFCKLEGAVASILIHPATPDKVLLLRDNNPLMIGDDGNFMYFASDKKAIHLAAKPWVKRHGIIMQVHNPGLSFIPMNNESAWIIGDKGIEHHEEFRCGSYRGRGNTVYAPMTDYHQRQQRAKAQLSLPSAPMMPRPLAATPPPEGAKPTFVLCLGRGCMRHIPISQEKQALPLSKLRCKHCKTLLSESVPALKISEIKAAARPN